MLSEIIWIIKFDLTYSDIADIALIKISIFLHCKYAMLMFGLKVCLVFNVLIIIITDVKQIIESLKFVAAVFMNKAFDGNE